MARDGIKTPKDTNFIVGILERENHGGETAKRKEYDVQMVDDCFRQPSKIASVETKKKALRIALKAQMVEATGFEPAESPGPKPGAIPNFAKPGNIRFCLYTIHNQGENCKRNL